MMAYLKRIAEHVPPCKLWKIIILNHCQWVETSWWRDVRCCYNHANECCTKSMINNIVEMKSSKTKDTNVLSRWADIVPAKRWGNNNWHKSLKVQILTRNTAWHLCQNNRNQNFSQDCDLDDISSNSKSPCGPMGQDASVYAIYYLCCSEFY